MNGSVHSNEGEYFLCFKSSKIMLFIGCMEGGTQVSDWIAWLIAGISTAALVVIWFVSAYRELARAKQNVENAIGQVRLHLDGCAKVGHGPYQAAAVHSLSVSRSIYCEAVKSYEAVRYKVVNRLPALLLGYRAIPETDGP